MVLFLPPFGKFPHSCQGLKGHRLLRGSGPGKSAGEAQRVGNVELDIWSL